MGAPLTPGDRNGPARGALQAVLLLCVLAGGCRERPGQIELPPLPVERDAGSGALPLPDGAIPCERNSDCDDGIDCSRDVCAPGRFCINASDGSRCSDGVFCNGLEVCDPLRGCRAGQPRRCTDDDVCTIDFCDEEGKRCAHDPRDFDDDGEIDWHCLGGTDCDDFDATRAQAVAEICGDAIDNDCDDTVDESRCGRALHDRCEDALDVSGGGRFLAELAGASPDYALGCSTAGARDVTFTFVTDKPHDVTLIASGLLGDGSEETATIALRTDCGDIETELECSRTFPAQVRIRALPAGRYFAIANSDRSAQLLLEARFDDPTEPPSNLSCDSPIDVSAGGRYEGNFVDVGDDEEIACGFENAGDLIYSFTTEQEHDVEIAAISLTNERMNFAVRTTCDEPASTLRCLSSAPARARLHQLPPGTYYVVLESSPSREVDFSLEVAFLEPTPPPPGDGCSEPLELPIGGEVLGTLANRQDLVNVQECGCDEATAERGCGLFLPDAVYQIQVDEALDLGLTIDSGGAALAYDLRSVCDSASAQVACGAGSAMIGDRVRNLQPGAYYLVLESPEPTNFTVALESMPQTVPVAAAGNDNCATAIEIGEEGGLFTGDTIGLLADYIANCGNGAQSPDAAFRMQLSQRSIVNASLEAQFDAVLYRFEDTGDGAASCDGLPAACDDDGGQFGSDSLLSETLDPGTYYYIVDGFNTDNQGRYLLEVSVSPQ